MLGSFLCFYVVLNTYQLRAFEDILYRASKIDFSIYSGSNRNFCKKIKNWNRGNVFENFIKLPLMISRELGYLIDRAYSIIGKRHLWFVRKYVVWYLSIKRDYILYYLRSIYKRKYLSCKKILYIKSKIEDPLSFYTMRRRLYVGINRYARRKFWRRRKK